MNEILKGCTLCSELVSCRKQVVLGEGDKNSPVMLVGINPGKEEDRTGRPFVGPAGKFLEEGLKRVGLSRNQLWITNILKCLTPLNREPTLQEAENCAYILQEEINEIKPLVIVPVGAWPLKMISGNLVGITKVAGKIFPRTPEICLGLGIVKVPPPCEIFPILHPAGVLRNMGQYRDRFFSDLENLVNFLIEIGAGEC